MLPQPEQGYVTNICLCSRSLVLKPPILSTRRTIGWLSDINVMSNCIGLFYTKKIGNCIPYTVVWFGLVWFYGTPTFVSYQCQIHLHIYKTVLFQTFQFSLSTQFLYFYIKQFNQCQLNVKKVLFQEIRFGTNTQFSSIWPIERSQSGATTPGQSGSGNNDNEGVLRIPQSSSITGTTPSDYLVSYTGHSAVYSSVPADWANCAFIFTFFVQLFL